MFLLHTCFHFLNLVTTSRRKLGLVKVENKPHFGSGLLQAAINFSRSCGCNTSTSCALFRQGNRLRQYLPHFRELWDISDNTLCLFSEPMALSTYVVSFIVASPHKIGIWASTEIFMKISSRLCLEFPCPINGFNAANSVRRQASDWCRGTWCTHCVPFLSANSCTEKGFKLAYCVFPCFVWHRTCPILFNFQTIYFFFQKSYYGINSKKINNVIIHFHFQNFLRQEFVSDGHNIYCKEH